MLGMIYQTSKLHPTMGINYRGHNLQEIIKRSAKAPGGEQPLPEAILWLLLSGDFPNKHEMEGF
jgi:citrate synthase